MTIKNLKLRQKNLAHKIKELRLSAGWSQNELARRIDATHTSINELERGHRFPGLKIALSLTEVFNISIAELVGEENHPVKNMKTIQGWTIEHLDGETENDQS